jgi:MCP family monocarboxylic acid transporter-like MFS transporter 10
MPLVLPTPLQQWGVDKTLRALSVVLLVVLLPALPFIRARLPEKRVARAHGVSPSQNRTWVRNPMLWLLACLIILHALAYYIPGTWLPSEFGLDSDRDLG